MAALTEATVVHNSAGKYKEVTVTFASAGDGDTYNAKRVGMQKVVQASVELTGGAVVAADSIAVDSVSGATVTLQQAGTARPTRLTLRGW